ncbi:MAG TPA: hypothetical protein VFA70_07540, partial [Dehalococcoidia bacterium]|nr:hypothetical protein [Dehalococcoidia bacterium]
ELSDAVIAGDAVTHRAVLIGDAVSRQQRALRSQTWAWDGTAWALLATSAAVPIEAPSPLPAPASPPPNMTPPAPCPTITPGVRSGGAQPMCPVPPG